MKALTDKIIDLLKERKSSDLLSTKEYFYKCAINDAIEIIKKVERFVLVLSVVIA